MLQTMAFGGKEGDFLFQNVSIMCNRYIFSMLTSQPVDFRQSLLAYTIWLRRLYTKSSLLRVCYCCRVL
jgi:hypothetical protein